MADENIKVTYEQDSFLRIQLKLMSKKIPKSIPKKNLTPKIFPKIFRSQKKINPKFAVISSNLSLKKMPATLTQSN